MAVEFDRKTAFSNEFVTNFTWFFFGKKKKLINKESY